ncbi:MAG: radical SAM protein [Treponema sp.]|jgi:DNA repair photolyase|nr:radical SAM protein [Treponema sp.]
MIIREIEAHSLLTKTMVPAADFAINPYVGCPHKCIFCYAEYMRRFTNHLNDEWGHFLDVKRYHKKLPLKRLVGKRILFSTVTDPYNHYEDKYCLMRGLLEQFIDTDLTVIILTRSNLVLRDLDLLKKLRSARVCISLGTLNDALRKRIEPGVTSVRQRLLTLKTLHEAGIPVQVYVSPIFPGIGDFKEVVAACRPYTNTFLFENLTLRGPVRVTVMRFIVQYYPQLISLYEDIYKRENFTYWDALEEDINEYCAASGIEFSTHFYHEKVSML